MTNRFTITKKNFVFLLIVLAFVAFFILAVFVVFRDEKEVEASFVPKEPIDPSTVYGVNTYQEPNFESAEGDYKLETSILAKEDEEEVEVPEFKSQPIIKPTPIPDPPVTPPPANNSCPISTQNCIPCKVGEDYCRYEAGATTGYLGWSCQNNNPGNIRPSTTSYPSCPSTPSYDKVCIITTNGGPVPCGKRIDGKGQGEYMIFSTYSDGKNALRAYIKGISKGQHKAYVECQDSNCTLAEVFGHYAPNDANYAQNIADKLGVSATTSLQWVIANQFEALIDAIQVKEGFFVK